MKRLVQIVVILVILLSLGLNVYLLIAKKTGITKIAPKIQNTVKDIKPTPNYGERIKVTKVIDGDTIELENGERLRYIGIDTPEKNDPRKPIQCFAEAASKKNKELVEGKMIKFYKDVNTRDKYGRLLGYVYRDDDLFVNLELVRQGYAFSYTYPPDISKQVDFREAERKAREQKIGLWSKCEVTENSSNHYQTNSVR